MNDRPPNGWQPAWHPDPTGRFEYRYHNGSTWTADVSRGGQRFVDPLHGPMQGGGGYGGPPAPSFTPLQRRSPKATAALVLGIIALVTGWIPFVFVAAVVCGILALIFGISALRSVPAGGPRRGQAVAGTVLGGLGLALCVVGLILTINVWRAVQEYTNPGDYDLSSESCVNDGNEATFSGRITNRSDKTRDYRIEVTFTLPDTQDEIGEGVAILTDVEPDGFAEWSVSGVVGSRGADCYYQVRGPKPSFDVES